MTKQLSIAGRCCACGDEKKGMRNLVYLPVLAMVHGRGWGCALCRLPWNGAIAVVRDGCFTGGRAVRWACAGWLADPARVPVSELMGEHIHDITKHPELGFGKEEVVDG